MLTGRNGTGKSTMLRCIAGLESHWTGELTLSGKKGRILSATERARLISIVLTERISLRGLNVRTLVEMGRYPHSAWHFGGKPEDIKQAEQAMEQLGILSFAERSMAELSDGERQKVMIARALCQNSPLLLLDEPTAFLDYVAREELMTLLKRLTRENDLGIVFSTHDIEIASEFADTRWHIESGKLNTSFPKKL